MNRHEATRRVITSIAVGGTKVRLPYIAPDGSQPLVVTTPGEYLSEVMKRVDAVGGGANIALAEVSRFFIFEIAPARAATAAAPIESSPTDHLNGDMSMGMFKLRYTGRKNARFAVKGVDVEVGAESSSFAYA